MLPYAFAFIFPGLAILGLAWGSIWAWGPVILAFVLTPVLDELIPSDEQNIDDDEERRRLSQWGWDALVVALLPAQTALIIATLVTVTSGNGTVLEVAGWVVSLGVVTGGTGITGAHELMHRKSRFYQAVAELLMAEVLYAHFCIEHILGHHRNVATPVDPASARKGESVWRFLPRTIVGGAISAWRLETTRVRAKSLPWWQDRRIRHPVLTAALLAAVGFGFGVAGLLVFATQAAIAVFLLEVINYVEHYGLARNESSPDRYERVQPHHSWNSAHRLTAWYLFNLPRHSDHHFLASRPYPVLRHFENVPQLPSGYPTMVLLALVPPLWRRVMDPRVDHWTKRGESLSKEGEATAA